MIRPFITDWKIRTAQGCIDSVFTHHFNSTFTVFDKLQSSAKGCRFSEWSSLVKCDKIWSVFSGLHLKKWWKFEKYDKVWYDSLWSTNVLHYFGSRENKKHFEFLKTQQSGNNLTSGTASQNSFPWKYSITISNEF